MTLTSVQDANLSDEQKEGRLEGKGEIKKKKEEAIGRFWGECCSEPVSFYYPQKKKKKKRERVNTLSCLD